MSKISTKLKLGFVTIFILFGAGNFMAYQALTGISNLTWSLRDMSLKTQEVLQLETLLPQVVILTESLLHNELYDKGKLDALNDHILNVFNYLKKISLSDDEKHQLKRMHLHFIRTTDNIERFQRLHIDELQEKARFSKQIRKSMKAFTESYDSLKFKMKNRLDAAYGQVESIKLEAIKRTGLTGLASILISIGVAYLIIRTIKKPLEQITLATEKLAEGNFDYQINLETKDELGNLAKSFDSMASKIKGFVRTD